MISSRRHPVLELAALVLSDFVKKCRNIESKEATQPLMAKLNKAFLVPFGLLSAIKYDHSTATCVDFIPLLLKKIDEPWHDKRPTSLSATSVLETLQVLDQQCRIFKRTAEELGMLPRALANGNFLLLNI